MSKGRTKKTYPKMIQMSEEIEQHGKPTMPAHLGEIAKKEFRRLVKLLSQTVVMNEADGNALGQYCQAYEHWVLAEQDVVANGLTVVVQNGRTFQNPCIQIAAESIKTMERIGKEFGLTPAARKKLAKDQEEKPKENKFLNFIKDKENS